MNTAAVVRQIALLVVLAAIAVAAIIWSGRDQDSHVPIAHTGRDSLAVVVLAHSETDTVLHTSLILAAPISALGALEQAAARDQIPMGLRDYDFGKLVVSIGGITSGTGEYWTYRLNGEFVPVAAGACMLADGDTLEFRFGDAPIDSL